jgi:hypothetical protein
MSRSRQGGWKVEVVGMMFMAWMMAYTGFMGLAWCFGWVIAALDMSDDDDHTSILASVRNTRDKLSCSYSERCIYGSIIQLDPDSVRS